MTVEVVVGINESKGTVHSDRHRKAWPAEKARNRNRDAWHLRRIHHHVTHVPRRLQKSKLALPMIQQVPEVRDTVATIITNTTSTECTLMYMTHKTDIQLCRYRDPQSLKSSNTKHMH